MRYMINLFAQLHALISVNKKTVCFHFSIFFPRQLFPDRSFEERFGISQFFPQSLNVGRDLSQILLTGASLSAIALLSISMFCNERGGGWEKFARHVYFKQYNANGYFLYL